MRWRAIAFVLLGINLVLAATWLISERNHNVIPRTSTAELQAGSSKTNYVVRRQLFNWRQIESSDYPSYISNLREIGCPEQTIRDIIIADVNSLYSLKRATNLVTSEQQWWRSEPDPAVILGAAEKSREMEDERHTLLSKLLGTNWESGDLVSLPRPSHPGVLLDGPVLGTLSAETKQYIEEVSVRSQDRLQNYLDAQRSAGKATDPAEIARLRQQTRLELQRVLSPVQLEEFLLRYSQDANNLRGEFGQLRYFNPTPNEFREVFRATDAIDQQIQLLANSTDPNDATHRKTLEDQRDIVVKNALGPKRYQEYVQLHDPAYRDAMASAIQAGTPEAVMAIYAVNVAISEEQNRIQADTSLTADQKAIELKRIELEQLKATTEATGGEVPLDPPPPTQPTPRKVHVLRPGDTPAVVALLYGLPISALKTANPNLNFNRLKPGDSIVLPPTAGGPFPGP